jgi:hypothetical protein
MLATISLIASIVEQFSTAPVVLADLTDIESLENLGYRPIRRNPRPSLMAHRTAFALHHFQIWAFLPNSAEMPEFQNRLRLISAQPRTKKTIR